MNEVLPAFLAAIAAAASALAAIALNRLEQRWGSADAFMRVSDRFEADHLRAARRLIYSVDRDEFEKWTEETRQTVEAWTAHLDLVAVLIRARQLDVHSFFGMYGDVVMRTIYQVAPYCRHEAQIRGEQYLLPLRLLTNDFLRLWRCEVKRQRYPWTIGFPAQPTITLNPNTFDGDTAIVEFRLSPPPLLRHKLVNKLRGNLVDGVQDHRRSL